MKLFITPKYFTLALLAFMVCGTARAQYSITGTTAGGGEIIVGNGSLGALNSASTPVALSAGGFDQVTLNIGSVATASGVDTIAFATSNDILLNNGTVTGAGNAAGNGFNAISFTAAGLSGEMVTNNGSAAGGSGLGNGSASIGTGGNGGTGGAGIAFNSSAALGGITLTNHGSAAGGSGAGNGGDGGFGPGGIGGVGGAGIGFNSTGALNGITLTNNGSATGGSGSGNGGLGGNFGLGFGEGYTGGTGGAGGAGIGFNSGGNISGITLTNNGSATGGSGSGNGGDGGTPVIGPFGGDGGTGGAGGAGIGFNAGGTLSGITLNNNGTITGGNGNGTGGVAGKGFIVDGANGIGGAGGSGIAFVSGTTGSVNLAVNNFGTITGGNSAAGNAGNGISSNAGNLTVNNWGAINAGSGLSTAQQAGFPAVAVSVSGNNNTINLNGHSSVNGTLEGAAGGTNNVLNLNFTGMTPASIAALKAQLTAEGWPGSNDFTGTFTVRGVTYYIDPLVLNLNVSSYQLQGVTPNQQAVGASLDSVTSNPSFGSPLGNLYNAIDLSGNVPGALEALSPQQYQAYGDLAIANTTAIVQNVDARLNNIRDGSESIDTTGVGGTSDATTTAGYSKDDGKESKNVVQTPAPEKRWGMFATGDGLFFRGGNHDVDLQDDRANSAGTLAGVDAKIGEHVVAGALFSYNNTDATLGSIGNSGHATIESYTGGVYGSYHQDGFYVNGLAAYTRNHYDSDRNIVFPGFGANASANANGNQASANIDGGYDWHATDRLTLGPIAGLQYVHLDVDGFNEAGAGAANLAVGSQNMNSLQSRVGGRINYHLLTSQYTSFAADLHAAYQHEFLDDSRGISASFIGDGLTPFSVQTTSPLRDAAVVGMGLNFTFHDRLTLFADYELLLWRASSFEQTLNGGGRISF